MRKHEQKVVKTVMMGRDKATKDKSQDIVAMWVGERRRRVKRTQNENDKCDGM